MFHTFQIIFIYLFHLIVSQGFSKCGNNYFPNNTKLLFAFFTLICLWVYVDFSRGYATWNVRTLLRANGMCPTNISGCNLCKQKLFGTLRQKVWELLLYAISLIRSLGCRNRVQIVVREVRWCVRSHTASFFDRA